VWIERDFPLSAKSLSSTATKKKTQKKIKQTKKKKKALGLKALVVLHEFARFRVLSVLLYRLRST
jgi:hypothetical protein